MAYELKITADGSPTLYDPDFDAHLHSLDGAVGESRYVFLKQSSLRERLASEQPVRVLEVGFGTGLNFTLSRELLETVTFGELDYIAFEPRPISRELLTQFYAHVDVREPLKAGTQAVNAAALSAGEDITLRFSYPGCQLTYYKSAFPSSEDLKEVDAVFYDAYGPNAHPALWEQNPLLGALKTLRKGGELVTFSITGNTKRLLKAQGYTFERLKGFGKKREMLKVYARDIR